MMRMSERRVLLLGFGTISLAMGILSALSYHNITQIIASTDSTNQAYEVNESLTEILTSMTVAESARRGFVFLGNEPDLARYQVAAREIRPQLRDLRSRLQSEPQQVQRLDRLSYVMDQRLDLLDLSMSLHEENTDAFAEQVAITNQSLELRRDIQAIMSEMQFAEQQILNQWRSRAKGNLNFRIWIETLITGFSFAVVIVGYTLLYRELMRRRQAEIIRANLEREKELSDLKLRFFSMVSHEFRTPLSVILGSAQMFAQSSQNWSDERRHKTLNRILSSARIMTQMLTDTLTLTRAEAGNLEFNPKSLDIEEFCLNLIEEFEIADNSQHLIQFRSQGTGGYVELDERLLYSILSNLLSNALKYSERGRVVNLLLNCQSDRTILQVTDQGQGMESTDLQKLFVPFYRGENVGKTPGSGLGLAVVKTCVDLHRGEILVESAIGIGTTVTVKLPRLHPENS